MDAFKWINEYKIVAIARKVSSSDIVRVARALEEGGIKLLEVTFNQESDECIKETALSIESVKAALGDKMCVGAGTVLTVEQAEAAFQSGADFALAPNVNVKVIEAIKRLGMVAVPGAMTPSEIVLAKGAGADIVKLFPAGYLGLEYVKAVKGPLGHIPLMAVGGVGEENIASFLKSGFCSCGVGSSLVRRDLISEGDFATLRSLAEKYVEAAKAL